MLKANYRGRLPYPFLELVFFRGMPLLLRRLLCQDYAALPQKYQSTDHPL
jgi:hypothetical protein